MGGGVESNAEERKNIKEAARGREKNMNTGFYQRGGEREREREREGVRKDKMHQNGEHCSCVIHL